MADKPIWTNLAALSHAVNHATELQWMADVFQMLAKEYGPSTTIVFGADGEGNITVRINKPTKQTKKPKETT